MGAERGVPSPSYFDTLPGDALHVVIRCLSERPRCTTWRENVDPNEAPMLFGATNSLAEAAISAFPSLNCLAPTNRNAGELRITNVAGDCHLPLMLARSAGRLEHLSLGHRPHALAGRMWLQSLQLHAKSLRSLDLRGAFAPDFIVDILIATGAVVRKLHLNCYHPPVVSAIAAHCSALTELAIFGRDAPLGVLWPAVGARLRALSFASSIRHVSELEDIQLHCTSLQTLELHCERRKQHLNGPIAALYASYGARLQRAKLTNMPPQLCALVADACGNLRCSAIVDENVAACAGALGFRLEKLKLDIRSRAIVVGIDGALANCSNLRELHLFFRDISTIADVMRAILQCPMSHVEVLEVTCVGGTFPVIEQQYTQNTGGLRRLMVSGVRKLPYLRNLAAHNKLLRYLRVDALVKAAPTTDADSAHEWVASALSTMEQLEFCAEMNEIFINIKFASDPMRAHFLDALVDMKKRYTSHRLCNHSALINGLHMFSS